MGCVFRCLSNLLIYFYICVCVCVCTYIYIYVCIYIYVGEEECCSEGVGDGVDAASSILGDSKTPHIHIYIHTYIHTYLHIHLHIHLHIQIHTGEKIASKV